MESSSFTFNPSVDNITGFADYPALSREGKFAQLPIVTGNNDFEAGIYIEVYALINQTESYNYWENHDNITFACLAGARANVSASHGLPTWRYRWFGNFLIHVFSPIPTVGHITALKFPLFGTHPLLGQEFRRIPKRRFLSGRTSKEHGPLLRRMLQVVCRRMRVGWPQYSPFEPTLIRLAYDNVTGTNLALPEIYSATCVTTYPIPDTNGWPDVSTTASSSSTYFCFYCYCNGRWAKFGGFGGFHLGRTTSN
jgi:hypothetical protein